MRVARVLLGKGFGQLSETPQRGVTKYHLSPFEQRAFAGAISQGLPNIFWRIKSNILTVLPPFVFGYLIYQWGEKEHERLQRKQPGQFDDET